MYQNIFNNKNQNNYFLNLSKILDTHTFLTV